MTTQTEAPRGEKGSDYAKLSRLVRADGLLERRPGYYTAKIAITLLLFAAGWVALFVIGASWFNLITAAYLAVMTTQVAFIGHDAGHRQVFRTNKANQRLNLVLGNLLIGMSTGWWLDKHNRHHANPNDVEKDPDVNMGALALTKSQAAKRGRAGRLLVRGQAYLFFPMLFLEGIALHVHGIRAMLGHTVKSKRMRALELFLLLLHIALYLGAVFYVLTPLQGVAFIAVNQGLWGFYMGISFAPNHKGMPYMENGSEPDFLRRQVLTSRNVRGNWFVDWLLGGLNYQIEHHLFPNMPRPNLRRAQPIIRSYCESLGVSYAETGAWESYRIVVKHLGEVGVEV